MLKLEGIVGIRLTDTVTGEVIEREQKNTFTVASLYRWLSGIGMGNLIMISTDKTPNNKFDIPIRYDNVYTHGYTSSGVTSPLWTEPTTTEPGQVLLTQRFDAPGSTRNIWSIIIIEKTTYFYSDQAGTLYETSSGNSRCRLDANSNPPDSTYLDSACCARVLLDTVCTQSTTQVLDVYYRIKFYIPPNLADNGIHPGFAYYASRKIANVSAPYLDYVQTSWSGDWPASAQSHPGLKFSKPFFPYGGSSNDDDSYNYYSATYIPHNSWHSTWGSPIGITPFSSSVDFRLYKRTMSYSMGLNDNVGRILGTMTYGSNWGGRGSTAAWHSVLPKNPNPNLKMQPVHNHSSGSNIPFIDVDNLAVGQGSMVLDGTNWVNKDYPEMYRVQICESGEPDGAARYSLFKRNHFGFNGNSYVNRTEHLGWFTSKPNGMFEKNHGQVEHLTITTGNSYNSDLAFGWNGKKYDYTSIVTSDKTGVQWTSCIRPESIAWDATSTPSLPVTYVSQFDISGTKILVGCRNTGIYIIDKELNTVNKLLVPGVVDKCYGVGFGYGNSIWAVMDGGIARSDDNGSTWTVYNESSTPSFTFSGISNSNWSTVAYMRIDKSATDFKMLLVRSWSTSVLQTTSMAWWSLTTTATAGYSNTATQYMRENKHFCDVSDKGWFVSVMDSGTRLRGLTFNSNATIDMTVDFKNYMGNISFDILPTGDEILWFLYGNSASSFYGNIAVRAIRRTNSHLVNFETMNEYEGSFHKIKYFSYRHIYLGKGIFTFTTYADGDKTTGTYPRQQHIQNLVSNYWSNLPKGGSHGKVFWDEYRWTGTEWSKNWHAPLIDSSGNANHGERKLMVQESHRFYGDTPTGTNDGYSTHVLAPNVATSLTTTELTWAATVKSTQTTGWSVLFELHTSGFPFLIGWNTDTANTFGIWTNVKTEFGVHPTDGLDHRLVITVNGTTVKAYIDGVQFGTTKTITGIPTSTATRCALGASTHGGYVQQNFNGYMTNVQVWDKEWLSTDAVYDFANQSGLVSDQAANPITTGNLKAWYKLTEPLIESKVCHTTSEPIIEGINLAFTPGSVGTSFNKSDFYTFGAVNGTWKDNATTYSGNYSIYITGQVRDCVDVELSGVVQVLPAITVPTVVTNWRHQDFAPLPDINTSTGVVTFHGEKTGVVSNTVFYGDFDVSFTNIQVSGLPGKLEFEFGVGTPATSETICWNYRDFMYHIFETASGNFGVYHPGTYTEPASGTLLINTGYGATAGTRLITDVFRFRKVGTTVTLFLNGTTISTTTLAYKTSYSPKMRVTSMTSGASITSPICTITSAAASQPLVMLGSQANKTGMFDPEFMNIDIGTSANCVRDISLNGVPIANLTRTWDYTPMIALPVINEAVTISDGMLVFNVADIGKTVTVTYDYLRFPA